MATIIDINYSINWRRTSLIIFSKGKFITLGLNLRVKADINILNNILFVNI